MAEDCRNAPAQSQRLSTRGRERWPGHASGPSVVVGSSILALSFPLFDATTGAAIYGRALLLAVAAMG